MGSSRTPVELVKQPKRLKSQTSKVTQPVLVKGAWHYRPLRVALSSSKGNTATLQTSAVCNLSLVAYLTYPTTILLTIIQFLK